MGHDRQISEHGDIYVPLQSSAGSALKCTQLPLAPKMEIEKRLASKCHSLVARWVLNHKGTRVWMDAVIVCILHSCVFVHVLCQCVVITTASYCCT